MWGPGNRTAATKISVFYQPIGPYGCPLAECQPSNNPVTLCIWDLTWAMVFSGGCYIFRRDIEKRNITGRVTRVGRSGRLMIVSDKEWMQELGRFNLEKMRHQTFEGL